MNFKRYLIFDKEMKSYRYWSYYVNLYLLIQYNPRLKNI